MKRWKQSIGLFNSEMRLKSDNDSLPQLVEVMIEQIFDIPFVAGLALCVDLMGEKQERNAA